MRSRIGRHGLKAVWAKTFIILLLVAQVGQASAERAPRPFQMALWDSVPGTDVDLPWFYENWPQPSGRAILQLAHWRTTTVTSLLNLGFDWSRIVAVVIDEPYFEGTTGSRSWLNPCRSEQDGRLAKITAAKSTIQSVANSVKVVSKSTRFWINFSEPELQWMMDSGCPVSLNHSYIHVISLDKYRTPFDNGVNLVNFGSEAASVKPYYDWLSVNRPPQQQFALVPGTFFRLNGHDDPNVMASYLPGFFDYAATMNRRCDLELGSTGVTGNYDRCRVWAVVGWTRLNSIQEGVQYIGYDDPLAQPIAAAWRERFAIPQRTTIVPALMNAWPLND